MICRRRSVPNDTEHDHTERNRQGLGKEPIDDRRNATHVGDEVDRREQLRGVPNYYYRRVA
ncbi:MAG: hypothetical protein GY946_11005 [bacterium]|nr:hypothetical protein [bacterium]